MNVSWSMNPDMTPSRMLLDGSVSPKNENGYSKNLIFIRLHIDLLYNKFDVKSICHLNYKKSIEI